ncbi:transposase [Streptomyces sp. NPDC005774]|uniref:transposase n=1 Tax=Streptomyces sp. NPDC005774 TaxID=3364728 RepID=UPI0036A4642F
MPVHCVSPSALTAITRTVTVAAGRFAPGHLGELTPIMPFELVETGARAVIGAVFGPTREGETSYSTRLLHHPDPKMLVLWDRGFDGNDFLAAVHATGAQVLGRISRRRRPPVLQQLADSSYLSVIGGVPVRIIEARVNVTCADGSTFEDSCRLVTTLLDARRYPADHLVRLYHERWEHESAYYALRRTILHGRVLRSHDPVGIEQEMWALLTLYQLLRRTMVEAAESQPGTDPDRCGFTTALQTTRNLLVSAGHILRAPARPVRESRGPAQFSATNVTRARGVTGRPE